jgi:hypothetical protein
MNELQAFLDGLRSEVFNRAHTPGDGNFRLSALAEEIFIRLEEVAVLTDAHVAFYRHERGNVHAEVHGFSYDSDDDVLSLFYFIDAHEEVALGDPTPVVGTRKEEITRAFRRLEVCVRVARTGIPPDLDEAQPAHELFRLIGDSLKEHRTIELHVVTTGTLTERAAAVDTDQRELRRDVWDLLRLQRVCGSSLAEGISVDFVSEHQTTVPCLATSKGGDGLQVMLACIPAKVLASIYNTYRARLLERNVRSFLQFTGKVNKGIRDTILNHPDRFLAYNNGLAATASRVDLEEVGTGLARIRAVHDFQIVNGGQTTASIASCARRDDADLSTVSVAMKLTVVPAAQVDGLVGLISKYANTQNRIQEADFSANHPWHIALERLSRSTWTAPMPDFPRGTRWYYERSRGQYGAVAK